mgnify:CR=1 FL=1
MIDKQAEWDQRRAEDEAWEEFMQRGKAVAKLADALNALKDFKPLTEEEIGKISWDCQITDLDNYLKFARAIEAAHGIKE